MDETTTATRRIYDTIETSVPIIEEISNLTRKKKKRESTKKRKEEEEKIKNEILMVENYDVLFKLYKTERSEDAIIQAKEKEKRKRLELERITKENKEFTGLEKAINPDNEIVGIERVFYYKKVDSFQSNHIRKKYKRIVKALKIAEKIFNEAFYDFDIITDFRNNYFNIIFHYPEVELENTMNDKIYIFDLYVSGKFSFNSETINFHQLNGIRTTFSLNEIESNYSHSHLQKNIFRMQQFCLGNNTPLRKLIGNNIDYTKILDQEFADYWLSYLYNIESFISWESLEGGPHSYMEKIKPSPARLENVIRGSNLESKTMYNMACKELHKDNSLIKGIIINNLLKISINDEDLNNRIKKQLNSNIIAFGNDIYHLTDEFKTNYSIHEKEYIKNKYTKKSVTFDFKMNRIHNVDILVTDNKNVFKSNKIGRINTSTIIMDLERKIIQNILK